MTVATALPFLTADDVAGRCHNPQPTKLGWSVSCPAKEHADTNNSATISTGKNGNTIIHCFGGCTAQQQCDGLGIQLSQLMAPRDGRAVTSGHSTSKPAAKKSTKPSNGLLKPGDPEELNRKIRGWRKDPLTGIWYYFEIDGRMVGAAARWDPVGKKKIILPFAMVDGRWQQCGMPEPRPLYGLLELISSTGLVWIVEGERKAEALRLLGLIVITSAHGAGSAHQTDWSPVAGRDCAIWPDNDPSGEKYATEVAGILSKLNPPANVRFVRPEGLPEGGDAYDFCEARDASEPEAVRDELEKLYAAAAGEKTKSAISIFGIGELIDQFPKLREPVIGGLIREGEVANLISKTKVGKSWTGYAIGLSVATGRPWLDRFNCRPGTVLLIDNELHPETLAHRVPSVAAAMSIGRPEYHDSFRVCSLRGQSKSILDLKPIFYSNPERYSLVIVDALYRAFPEGMSENDNGAMAQIYNALDEYAAATGAAFLVIHHSTKGEQAGKDVSDVGSGAGAQSRAADSHLILRPHEEDGCVVLDAIVRSFEPVEPMVLRWNFPVWLPADELDPADLKQARPKRGGGSGEDPKQQLEFKRREIFNFLFDPKRREIGATKNMIKESLGISRHLDEAIQSLVKDGNIEACKVKNPTNKQAYDGWRVKPEQGELF